MKTDDPHSATKMAEELCSVQPIDLILLKRLWVAMYPPIPTITPDEKVTE